ncbi:membrane-associated tyrosine- and threonine-specific cdc2-inhibitory kinase [Drosophila rhopaloa]|uniref:Membrane-associated tyrosine- and threonine-specific cdc2-inhibitory kinase n=1 Tax=Drosophila rhopaloa TaxID=1041015 RepID=A0A6P4DZM8_DRORH|nr:membrane-associated tyrosine- and threonine-specific cdc2-inhibitory kinase [Drosophila rhopaloa]
MEKHRLPLPELHDDKHRHKQCNGDNSNRFRPPKYKTRGYVAVDNNNLNRSQSLGSCSANSSQVAHAISFRGLECPDASTLPLSPVPLERSERNSHFEQCFERLAKLGEGSFGEVFKVRDRSDGRFYAVKISKQLFRGEQYRAERLEEVRRYEEFSGHENCIRFIRAWEQYDRLYMQMELCRESLEQYLLRCQRIPEERIWHILLDLLRGLKSLHDRNLIHLDIKLDNVLIGEDDETCKLADFGLVIDVDRANSHHATEGDSRYMAPEILQGHFSKAADIFSLGIAMLELACYMDLPSNGPLWHELRNGILPEEFINKISLELQSVIKSMMMPDPARRPTADQLLSHPKLQHLQQKRKSLMNLSMLSRSFRRSRRAVWGRMCNWKTSAFRYLLYFLEVLHLCKPIGPSQPSINLDPNSPSSKEVPLVPRVEFQLVGSTPIANRDCYASDFPFGEDPLELSHQGSPNVINSTPLNTNQGKSRMELLGKNLDSFGRYPKMPDFESLNSPCSALSSPKVLDTSSFRRKKLFVMEFDDE